MEIDKEVQNILNEDLEQVNEMSRAFSYKDRRIDVCAWVENPMGANNQYFKYYNCSTIPSATKVARIRLDRPSYVGGNHREGNKQKWILSDREKSELVEILKGPSQERPGLTRWQDVIITYNQDNFNLSSQDTINGNFVNAQKDPRMSDDIQPYSIDTPMPDYLNLSE